MGGGVAYLGGVVIIGGTQEEHNASLGAVFQPIKEHGFQINPGKCSFFLPSFKYLDLIAEADVRRPDPQKIETV